MGRWWRYKWITFHPSLTALASVDEFGEQLRLNGCVNHHFVSYMMRNSIMQAFMDMAKAERKEERRRKRAEAKAK
ncbi:hypothetical protein U9467_24470 [Escherichia coli]